MKDREILARDGFMMVIVNVDNQGRMIGDPEIISRGFIYLRNADDLAATMRCAGFRYVFLGIENVLALAGDPPDDGSDPGGDFTYACELVELAHEVDGFAVAVAAFPEIHPRSPDRETDRRQLAAKLADADFGMTQFFWDVEHYRRMVDELTDLVGA